MNMQYKGIFEPLRDLDTKGRIVTGFLSRMGVVDRDGEIIQKGAFAKTIQERGPQGTGEITHCLDHKLQHVVGNFMVLKEVSNPQLQDGSVKEGDYLYYESYIPDHNDGEDFLKMVKGGIIKQHSIGFRPVKKHKSGAVTVITEIKLVEGSSLRLAAANPDTPIVGIKSASDALDMMGRIEHLIKHGDLTDEGFIQLQQKLQHLHEYFKTTQPEDSTVPSERKSDSINYLELFKQGLQHGSNSTGN